MEATLREALGKKLRILRTHFGFQQKDMAIKFNIGQPAYSDLEMGNTNFTDEKISKICEVFNINFQEFLSIENLPLSEVKSNAKLSESSTIRILKLIHQKELLERDLKIIRLEREVARFKGIYPISDNPAPIYVLF